MQRLASQPRQFQQIVHHHTHVHRALLDALEVLARRGGELASQLFLEHLREAVHVAQRRAQVVGHGVRERLELPVRGRQLAGALGHTALQVLVQTADLLERRPQPSLRRLQLVPRLVTLDRVADRARQQIAVHLPLDEIVLRAVAHRRDGQRFIAQAGEHDDRHVGRVGPDRRERAEAGAVGQGQVEQDDVDAAGAQPLERGREPPDALQLERPRPVRERLLDEQDVTRVVLHEEDLEGGRHPISVAA